MWSFGVSIRFKQSKHGLNINSNGYQKKPQKRFKTTKNSAKTGFFYVSVVLGV